MSEQLTKTNAALSQSKGYKQTEVGLIPEDWNVLAIGDSLIFKNGLNKESEFFGYGTPIINYMDVFKNYGISKKDIKGKVFLNSQEIQSFSAKKGDVFFTRTSETQEEIGTSAVLMEEVENCVFSGFVLRGRPKNNVVSSEYYQYCLIPNYIRSQIISTSSYTTRALTNGRFLSTVKLIVPPTLTEQKAIATALSDVDDLIANLDKLISKKKAIKQGAMQQLLTPPHKGGKRLAGYSGDWEEKGLGEITNIKTGSKNNQDKVEDGEYPFFVRSQTVERINSYSYDCEAILIPGEGGIGSIYHYINGKFEVHQRVYKISDFKEGVLGKFIYLKLLFGFYNHAMTNSVKATVDSLRLPTFLEFIVDIPPTIEEQIEIAEILSDMDSEIEQLETKKAKYQDIKQGMMQELLTGKTRLV